jgi:hypothetical protein
LVKSAGFFNTHGCRLLNTRAAEEVGNLIEAGAPRNFSIAVNGQDPNDQFNGSYSTNSNEHA